MLSVFFFFRGALTSKPYAFLARPWEFKSVDSIDVFDSLGSNIRVDVRGDKILRVLPRSNDFINEDWISDRIRFICDSVRLQRLDLPLLKFKNKIFKLNWNQVFHLLNFSNFFFSKSSNIFKQLNLNYKQTFYSLNFIKGLFMDLESAGLFFRFNSNFFLKNFNYAGLLSTNGILGLDRNNFIFQKNLEVLSSYSSIVLVGLNIKLISPVFNIRLRNLAKSGIGFYNFGYSSFQNLFCDVGSFEEFYKVIKGKHWLSNRLLRGKTFFLFGEGFNLNNLIFSVLNKFNVSFSFFSSDCSTLNLKEFMKYDSFKFKNNALVSSNFIHTNCSKSSLLDLNYIFKNNLISSNSFKVAFLSHGGISAEISDFLIPISSSFEQSKYYLNVLGIKQKTRLCLSSPNNVLDHSDVISLFYLYSLITFFKKLDKLSLNVQLLTFLNYLSVFYLKKSKEDFWKFLNYFFDLVSLNSNNSIFLSRLVGSIFSDLNFIKNDLVKKDTFFLNLECNKNYLLPLKINKLAPWLNSVFLNPDFYQNDEISFSSSTLTSASRRLILKNSFF